MNDTPQISTVDQACGFVCRWFGWKSDLAGGPITLPFTVPPAIEIVNRRLGRLWLHGPEGRRDIDLFGVQDKLVSPHRYEVRPDGIVPMIWENQAVWGCGFKPELGAQLWVVGDWPQGRPDAYAWRPTRDVVDSAVIFVLLANMLWACANGATDTEDDKPAEAEHLLWTFAPWPGFTGFWTNNDNTVIRMQGAGWGVTARR